MKAHSPRGNLRHCLNAPLTQEEVNPLQAQFASLHERWINMDEIGTQEALEQLQVDQLRRFTDANNLDVTSKIPKEKALHLIGARFRLFQFP